MLLLLLLIACHVDTVCAHDALEVADDDPLGDLDFTVGDIVADVAGARTFPAANALGAALSAELAMARADGPAIFSDASWVDTGLRPGLGLSQNLMFIVCEDTVTVPFELDLAASDGSVAVAGQVEALGQRWSDTTQGVGGISVWSGVDEDGALSPDAAGGTLGVQFEGPDLIRVDLSSEDLSLAFPPEAE